ncbi:MAG: 23S rRNA pseudouridine(1911/1915/1917) synthase RluD [Pseudomonadota bacterium]
MITKIKLDFTIPEQLAGERLDRALAKQLPQYSRSRLKQWLTSGQLTIDGASPPPKYKIAGGEQVSIRADLEENNKWEAQAIDLDIIFEDESLLVINKPIDFVVHPGAGNSHNTLANALLHYHPPLAKLPRSGIVHRIDKDTTGLLVVAKTLEAQTNLIKQLQEKRIKRQYEAIVNGHPTGGGTINAPIGRHPKQRTKMAVVENGKMAITHYRIIEHLPHHTRLKVRLETGRTHQIRVHLAHIGYPIVGDQSYGGRLKLPKNITPEVSQILRQFKRQALHARWLELKHPINHEQLKFEAPLPDDIKTLLNQLGKDSDIKK